MSCSWNPLKEIVLKQVHNLHREDRYEGVVFLYASFHTNWELQIMFSYALHSDVINCAFPWDKLIHVKPKKLYFLLNM